MKLRLTDKSQRAHAARLLRGLHRGFFNKGTIHPCNRCARLANAIDKRLKTGTKQVTEAHMYARVIAYRWCNLAGLV